MNGSKPSPVFGFNVQSTWDRLGEIPGLSTVTSAVRIVKGSLCGLWDVVSLAVRGKSGFAAVKQDLRDIGVGIAEIVPFVNIIAARYFNRAEMLETLKHKSKKDLNEAVQGLKPKDIDVEEYEDLGASPSPKTQKLSLYEQRMLSVYEEALSSKMIDNEDV